MEQTTDTRGIVDTDILIDGQRRRDDARDFLARQRRVVGLEISVTKNVRHFLMIPGLTVVRPY